MLTRKAVFLSKNQDQIDCLNYHLNSNGIKTELQGRLIFSSRYSYKKCLFLGAIFADDFNLTDIKWIAPNGYVQHNLKGLVSAARTSLNPNSYTNQILKQLYSNPFQANQQTPPAQPNDPQQDQ